MKKFSSDKKQKKVSELEKFEKAQSAKSEHVDRIIVNEERDKLPHHLLVKGSLDVLKEMWANTRGTKR